MLAHLADPRHRPQWQSSLAGVELLTGPEVRVGQRWVDVTVPRLRPVMETVELDPPRRWVERGTWRGVEAWLALDLTPTDGGCEAVYTFSLTGRGRLVRPLALPLRLLTALAGPAVRADLRRAARQLGRPPGA